MDNIAGKADLSQKTLFTTIRLKTNISAECVTNIVRHCTAAKNVLQSMIVVEKHSNGVACTHNLHAHLHYKTPVQFETVKKIIKTLVNKHHNPEKDGSKFAVMLKTNTCYTYKDYLTHGHFHQQ